MTGLNWTAYLALLPEGVNRERMKALARPYEAGLIMGSAELVKKS